MVECGIDREHVTPLMAFSLTREVLTTNQNDADSPLRNDSIRPPQYKRTTIREPILLQANLLWRSETPVSVVGPTLSFIPLYQRLCLADNNDKSPTLS